MKITTTQAIFKVDSPLFSPGRDRQQTASPTPLESSIKEFIGDLEQFLTDRQLPSSSESAKKLCLLSESIDGSLLKSPASTTTLLAYIRAKFLFDSLQMGGELPVAPRGAQLDTCAVKALAAALEHFEKLKGNAQQWDKLQIALRGLSPTSPGIQRIIDIGMELSTTFAESLSLVHEIEQDLEKTTLDSKESLRHLLSACQKFKRVRETLDSMRGKNLSFEHQKAWGFTDSSLTILYQAITATVSRFSIGQKESDQALFFWAGRAYDRERMTRFLLKALVRCTLDNDDVTHRALLDGCILQIGSEPKEMNKWGEIVDLYTKVVPTTEQWSEYIQRVHRLLCEIRKTLENPNSLESIKAFHIHEAAAHALETKMHSQGIKEGIPIAETFSHVHELLKQQPFFPPTREECELNIAKIIVHALYSSDMAERESATDEGNALLCRVAPDTLREIQPLIDAFKYAQLKKAGDIVAVNRARASIAAASLPPWISPLKSASTAPLAYAPGTLFLSPKMVLVDCGQLERRIETLTSPLWEEVVEIYRAILRAKTMLLTLPDDAAHASLERCMKTLSSVCTKHSLLTGESLLLAERLMKCASTEDPAITLQQAHNLLFPLLIERALGVRTHQAILSHLPAIVQQLGSHSDLKPSIIEDDIVGELVVSLFPPHISDRSSDIRALKEASDQILSQAAKACPLFGEIATRHLKQIWKRIEAKKPRFSTYSSRLQSLTRDVATLDFPNLCKNLKECETILSSLAKYDSSLPTNFNMREFFVSKPVEAAMEQAFRLCVESIESKQIVLRGQQLVQKLVDELGSDLPSQFVTAQQKLGTPVFKKRLRDLIPEKVPDSVSNILCLKFFGIKDKSRYITSFLKRTDYLSLPADDLDVLKKHLTQYYLRLLILFSGQTLGAACDMASSDMITGRWQAFSPSLITFPNDPLLKNCAQAYMLLSLRPRGNFTNPKELTEAYVSYVDLIVTKLSELFFMQATEKKLTGLLKKFLTSFERLCLAMFREEAYSSTVSDLHNHFTNLQPFLQKLTPEAREEVQKSFHEQRVSRSCTLKTALEIMLDTLKKKGPSLQENKFMANLLNSGLLDLIPELSALSNTYRDNAEVKGWIVNVVGRLSKSMREFLTICPTEPYRDFLMKAFFQLDELAKKLG